MCPRSGQNKLKILYIITGIMNVKRLNVFKNLYLNQSNRKNCFGMKKARRTQY